MPLRNKNILEETKRRFITKDLQKTIMKYCTFDRTGMIGQKCLEKNKTTTELLRKPLEKSYEKTFYKS